MPPLIAVDIGNSRIKLGFFAASDSTRPANPSRLPEPSQFLAMPTTDWDAKALDAWLSEAPPQTSWWIASVNRPAAARLSQWATLHWPVRLLAHSDLPIATALEHPERIGIDRLAGAAAANRLRNPQRPAIVVGVGTAVTVDFLSPDGTFRGGAILPGISMSARALDQFTDLLPLSPLEELAEAPPALGTSTLAAIHSGLYWGAVGAIRELITRLSAGGAAINSPQIFLTGGAAPSVAKQLDPTAQYVEHLVLSGIALAKPATISQDSQIRSQGGND